MADTIKQRPGPMRLIDATQYRLPVAAQLSILHRASGIVMFLLLPFIVWMFDASISSEPSFDGFASVFATGAGFVPGWFFKLVALALIWAYLHHVCAGVRHVWMDITHHISGKPSGRASAIATLVVSLVLTVVLAAKLFGLY